MYCTDDCILIIANFFTLSCIPSTFADIKSLRDVKSRLYNHHFSYCCIYSLWLIYTHFKIDCTLYFLVRLFELCTHNFSLPIYKSGFPSGSVVKNPRAMQETWVWSLGQESPLEKGMETHSSVLAWEIPRTEELCGLQFTGLQRFRYDWRDWGHTHSYIKQK